MAAAGKPEIGGAGEVGSCCRCCTCRLLVQRFFELVKFFLCTIFQFVEVLSHLFALFGGHTFETLKQRWYLPFFADVGYAESIELAGVLWRGGIDLLQQLVNFIFHGVFLRLQIL
jgi:hypothetical protein